MSLPKSPPIFKPNIKRPQYRKNPFKDRGHHVERVEKSCSSLQGVFTMRSAFEDLTNACQIQPAQPKKGYNEFVKDVSKKTKGNIALSLTKTSKMNSDRYKPKPVVASSTLVLNKEKLPPVEKSTISKAPTTEEASALKKTQVSEDEESCDHITIVSKLSSSRRRFLRCEMPLLKKTLAFQKENDSDNDFFLEEMAVKKRRKMEEATTKKTLPSEQKTSARKEYKFSWKDFLSTDDSSDDDNPFGVRFLKIKKKSKTEKPTTKPLSLKMCTPQRKSSHRKPLALQWVSCKDKPLTKEPFSFNRKPAMEKESLCQEPSALREKHASEEKSLSREALALKKKRAIEEAPQSSTIFPKKQKQAIGWAVFPSMPPVLQKGCPATEEQILPKIPLSSNKEQVTKRPVTPLRKPLVLQKNTFQEDSVNKKLLSSKKQPFNAGDVLLKAPSALTEKRTAPQEVSFSKKKSTMEKQSPIKRSLTLKAKPTGDEIFFSPELFSPAVTHDIAESTSQVSLVLLAKPDPKEDSFHELLTLKDKSITERESLGSKKLLLNQLSTEAATSTECQLSSEKEPTAQGKRGLLQKQLAPWKNITKNEEPFTKQPLALQEKSHSKKGPLCQQQFSFKRSLTFDEECYSQGPVIFQERARMKGVILQKQPSPRKEEAPCKQQLSFQKKLSLEKDSLSEGPLIFREMARTNDAKLREPCASQEKPSPEKGTLYKKCLSCKKTLTFDEECYSQGPVILQDRARVRGINLNEHWAFQKKSSPEKKKPIIKEALASEAKTVINGPFVLKEVLILNKNLTTGKRLFFEETMALGENSFPKGATFLKTFLMVPLVKTSSDMSSTALGSRLVTPRTPTTFGVHRSSSDGNSSTCEFSCNKFSTPNGKGEQVNHELEDTNRYYNDPYVNSAYAKDIFNYMKEREKMFILTKYMSWQVEISSDMRAILVDWLVEVQMGFEMSHETLYLAVKLVDHYLNETICKKEKLQLLGCAAFLIAAKFEESSPPCVRDLLYICDNIYLRREMLAMEMSILTTLNFDINIPSAYHYLRRYAKCVHASMRTLTLSRFICEMTLQKYDYVEEKASKLAAGAFLLALYMKNLRDQVPSLEFYSGYTISELYPLVKQLNGTLTLHFRDKLRTVYSKYSQSDFFKVSTIPPLEISKLEEMFKANCEVEGLVFWQ
ncbi:LOW QUALITY PROTEIN: G2/mitotic-specific cyclin-B3-like [Lepus europaeus]|uniref:LOW QUALITY PROTEIN: G2/mitotic-specific cyclin-B3-like n=1 Tax=Lepus europaeus TaxID=9983 RepID=UPI002B4947F7|nr:LOW QUALITY PROTEIN: G2/mitotic-specific cyclin-B3-like [Lepus europaeus]